MSNNSNPLLSCFTEPPTRALSQRSQRVVCQLTQWCEAHLTPPQLAKHWEAATFPQECWDSFSQQTDLLGFTLPLQYQPKNRSSSVNVEDNNDVLLPYLMTKILASYDASFTTALLVQYGLCAESILLCGSSQQKQQWLPALASLALKGCFCLTEPQSGSDASNLQTTARRVEDSYVLNGSKRWIGNAEWSDLLVVWARNLDLPGHPVMGFVVPRRGINTPQTIRLSKIQGKTGLRMVQNANIEFVQARCPLGNILAGDRSNSCQGFAQSVGRVLEASRLSVAWIPVGMGQGALDLALAYMKERVAFGSPLASTQLVQERLVKMTSMVASMHVLAERLTQEYDAGKATVATISMVKAHHTWLGRQVVAMGRELLGGNGIVLDYGMASKFADMEAVHTYEGTYDICTLVAGRALTGTSAIHSGAAESKKKTSSLPRSKL